MSEPYAIAVGVKADLLVNTVCASAIPLEIVVEFVINVPEEMKLIVKPTNVLEYLHHHFVMEVGFISSPISDINNIENGDALPNDALVGVMNAINLLFIDQ